MDVPEPCHPHSNTLLQQQAESLLPYYSLNELAQHNDSTDAWICLFGLIYDITPLVPTGLFQQFVNHAGHDLSLFFDEQTHEPRTRIDPQTHQSVPLIDHLSAIQAHNSAPFWQTTDYLIGRLIEHPRLIRLLHSFDPLHPHLLEVDDDETVGQIAKKFLAHNAHVFSYTWRYDGRTLDFHKTLRENGIDNDEVQHEKYIWRSNTDFHPTIVLHYTDDLTIA